MLIFIQFFNFERALGKISFFKNCSSDIWSGRFSQEVGDFLNIFLIFWGFWDSISYKDLSYKKDKRYLVLVDKMRLVQRGII